MPRSYFLSALAITVVSTAIANAQNPRFAPYPEARFSAMAKQSINTYFTAEDAYKAGEYERAKRLLTVYWRKYPPGHVEWENAHGDTVQLAETTGAFYGDPVCYSALRMLTDCVDWRLGNKGKKGRASPVVWTVVLVGKSAGLEPRTERELADKGGVQVEHTLDLRLVADDHRILRESMWLFMEHVAASTFGDLEVEVEFVPLPKYTVPVEAYKDSNGVNLAAPFGLARTAVFDQIPAATRRRTDWWFIIYPSNVPNKYPPFARIEFVTGGMDVGPDGSSPFFLINDRWFTSKPPHLGTGDYSDHERRAYLPMWFQHEFYHHLFRTYPEMKLEAKSHQWFDRKTWPADFVGRLEADYYHEALHKRFRTAVAKTPLALALRYAAPSADVLKRLKLADIVGEYALQSPTNDWHRGAISMEKNKEGKDVLRWTNAAGKSWQLNPDLPNGVLNTGPDNPYFKDGGAKRMFTLVLSRDGNGECLPQIHSYRFDGSEYVRQGNK